jgi:hypothetical protein
MRALADQFETSVRQIAQELSDAVAALHQNAEVMSQIATLPV